MPTGAPSSFRNRTDAAGRTAGRAGAARRPLPPNRRPSLASSMRRAKGPAGRHSQGSRLQPTHPRGALRPPLATCGVVAPAKRVESAASFAALPRRARHATYRPSVKLRLRKQSGNQGRIDPTLRHLADRRHLFPLVLGRRPAMVDLLSIGAVVYDDVAVVE